jgi:hypothetical protein
MAITIAVEVLGHVTLIMKDFIVFQLIVVQQPHLWNGVNFLEGFHINQQQSI